MKARRLAFSLIEVMVALSLGGVVVAVAYNVFAAAKYTAVESALRGQLARDAALALDMLGKDLSALGAGVPEGTCGDASCSAGSSLRPSVRVGRTTNLVFLGDAPYPNAELPGVAVLTRFAGDADSANVAVSSEVSGGCTPYATTASNAYHCDTGAKTLLVGPTGAFAADTCLGGQEGRRTCPWALNKWQVSGGFANFIATAPDGSFFSRRWNGAWTPVDNHQGITLSAAVSGSAPLTRNTFFAAAGGGALVQLDRIFWALENAGAATECNTANCVLKRRQCWGLVVNPAAAGFPTAASAFVGSTATLDNCTAGTDGTGWETILSNIESLSFSYFQTTSTALTAPLTAANLALVRGVEVDMVLKKDTPGSGPVLRHRVRQRFFLPNRDRVAP